MRNMIKEQTLNRAFVRTLITTMFITGWMVLTGSTVSAMGTACFDQGRSGYWCPDASSKMAANISDRRAGTQSDLIRLQGEKDRVTAELGVANQQLENRERLSKELSAVKQQIMELETQLERMGQSSDN